MTRPKKPMLFAKAPSDVRRHHEDPTVASVKAAPGQYIGAAEPPEGGWDAFYVPGYSDIRALNDHRLRDGLPAVPVPAGVAWVRYTRDNRDHYSGAQKWFRAGYKIVEDAREENGEKRSQLLEDFGYGAPPAAVVTNEGHFRVDDVVLAWCPGEKHEKNIREHAEKRKFREGKKVGPRGLAGTETEHEEKITVGTDEALLPPR